MRRRVACARFGASTALATSIILFAGCGPAHDAAARNADSTRADMASVRAMQEARSGAEVRRTVQRYYDAFNAHSFSRAPEFTTEDWVHINPFGGVTRGRAAVLAELRQVHDSLLKGVTDTPDSMEVRFATPTSPSRRCPGA
jgi:hypothetical protein